MLNKSLSEASDLDIEPGNLRWNYSTDYPFTIFFLKNGMICFRFTNAKSVEGLGVFIYIKEKNYQGYNLFSWSFLYLENDHKGCNVFSWSFVYMEIQSIKDNTYFQGHFNMIPRACPLRIICGWYVGILR